MEGWRRGLWGMLGGKVEGRGDEDGLEAAIRWSRGRTCEARRSVGLAVSRELHACSTTRVPRAPTVGCDGHADGHEHHVDHGGPLEPLGAKHAANLRHVGA